MRIARLLSSTLLLAAVTAFAETGAEKPVITLEGHGTNAVPGSFTLDYGNGTVLVDTVDWPWYQTEGHGRIDGNPVRVRGVPDTDFGGGVRIDAAALYLPSLGFRARADAGELQGLDTPPSITAGRATVRGTVTGISGTDLTLGIGPDTITVDTANLATHPLDQPGDPELSEGDRIRAEGHLNGGAVEPLSLKADTLIITEKKVP